jgi:excisionase family DNA binding protein
LGAGARAVGDVTEPLLTAREAAEILGVATGTVLDWFEAGRVPGFKLGDGAGAPVRFRGSELEAWLEGCRRGPAPSLRPGAVA